MRNYNNGCVTPCGVYPRRLMTIYYDMKQRCYYDKHRKFHLYGGRGIKVCSEWLGDYGAKNFYDWALENGYDKEMTLDRIDNDLGYSPKNCRFVPSYLQSSNRRVVISRGELHHIEKLPYNGWRVCVRKNGHRYRRIFKELNAAKQYRDVLFGKVMYGNTYQQ